MKDQCQPLANLQSEYLIRLHRKYNAKLNKNHLFQASVSGHFLLCNILSTLFWKCHRKDAVFEPLENNLYFYYISDYLRVVCLTVLYCRVIRECVICEDELYATLFKMCVVCVIVRGGYLTGYDRVKQDVQHVWYIRGIWTSHEDGVGWWLAFASCTVCQDWMLSELKHMQYTPGCAHII